MKFKNFLLNNAINNEIQHAYITQNINKLEIFKAEGYDLIKHIKSEDHPLIDSLNLNLKKNVKFFLINFLDEEVLERALILTKKNNLIDMEKIITLFCHNKRIKYSNFSSEYRQCNKEEIFIKKYL